MLGNATQDKNGKMISVTVSIKNQKDIAHVKKMMSGILVRVFPKVINIVT